MSFALTRGPILARTKRVTRRLGWWHLRRGDLVLAVSKGMGLKPGERPELYYVIEIDDVRTEPLSAITAEDVVAEGFPDMTPADFVAMFCAHNGCEPTTIVNRIAFHERPDMPLPDVAPVRFRVLLADPPWQFGDTLPGDARGADKHYPTMSLAEICTFPLPPLEDDAALVIWRVGSMQHEALAVARAWGFSPPTSEIVWIKTTDDGKKIRIGMGRTVRNAHEVALICRRGRPVRRGADVPSVFMAPRARHSAKPDRFYSLVERLYAGPYVELFARVERPGWTTYGNELAVASPPA